MDTIVQIAGMTEAVFALVLVVIIGIASCFIRKSDVENMDKPAKPKNK